MQEHAYTTNVIAASLLNPSSFYQTSFHDNILGLIATYIGIKHRSTYNPTVSKPTSPQPRMSEIQPAFLAKLSK
ncbi:hypothetical protein JCM14076_29700 [Methylosoma difficile]